MTKPGIWDFQKKLRLLHVSLRWPLNCLPFKFESDRSLIFLVMTLFLHWCSNYLYWEIMLWMRCYASCNTSPYTNRTHARIARSASLPDRTVEKHEVRSTIMVENEAWGMNGWYWQESVNSEVWRYHQSIVYRTQKSAKTPGASRTMKVRYYCRILKQISINLLDLCPFLL